MQCIATSLYKEMLIPILSDIKEEFGKLKLGLWKIVHDKCSITKQTIATENYWHTAKSLQR